MQIMCVVFFPLEQWSTFLLPFKGICVPLPGPLTFKFSYPNTSVPGPLLKHIHIMSVSSLDLPASFQGPP